MVDLRREMWLHPTLRVLPLLTIEQRIVGGGR